MQKANNGMLIMLMTIIIVIENIVTLKDKRQYGCNHEYSMLGGLPKG